MMTRTVRRVRLLAGWALWLLLAGFGIPPARADGPTVTAVFGIAGRYRPGTWCPVTVTLQNVGADGVAGQAQVMASEDAGRPNGGGGSNSALGGALFARPLSVPPGASGPTAAVVYARGIDPGRDTVTVQVVDGRERGDGRVLTQTTNQPGSNGSGSGSGNGPPTITGNPVSDTDLLLVGFGGDPGAFSPLSGQKLGLAHVPGGLALTPAVSVNGMPATAQVASAGASDLPDRAAGYSGVDAFLLRPDAPLDALTEAQAEALKGWVAAGGHLVVCGGSDPSRFGSPFFAGLLPANVGAVRPSVPLPGVGPVAALTLAPKPLPGVRVLLASGGLPLIVSGPYGAGSVTFAAYDPTAGPFHTVGAGTAALWQTLLGASLPSSVLGHVAAREENYTTQPYYYGGSSPALLSDAVMRAPSLDAPGTEVIGLFLLVYLIVLVPANYLVLKRMDRKEMAWVTIPALVLLFALGTFGVGYAAKGGAVFVNRAAVVETTAGRREAGVYAEVGLFSPHRTTYDISLPNALAAIPNPGETYGYRPRRGGGETQSYGQTRFVQTASGSSLLDTSVNMWAMRAFDAQATTDLGGTVDATFNGTSGSVTNHTPYPLTDCALIHGGQPFPVPDLSPGASAPLTTSMPTAGGQGHLPLPTLSGRIDKDDPASGISQRMRAALADYARSLGEENPNGYYNGNAAPSFYAAAPSEALFVAWSNDPALAGPAPRVDGRHVTENDVTLLVVHLPLAGIAPGLSALPALPPTRFNFRGRFGGGFQFPSQQTVASPSATFGGIARTSPLYKSTMDAHNLALARQGLGRPGRFHGTVTQVYQDAQHQTLVLDFDPQYRQALTAVLTFRGYRQFPNMQTLQGREVVVSGPLIQYGDKVSVMLSQPSQIQVVH